jgi:hypothetical protein
MNTNTFTPSFTSALLENIIVFLGIVIGTPVVLLSRSASHRSMTIGHAITAGLIGGVLLLLFYTARFVWRVPKTVVVSESDLLLRWRNGSETRMGWDGVRRAVFRVRWGYRWKFYRDDSAPVLWGDGFSAATWEQMSSLIEAQLTTRGVPMEKYDLSGRRVV